ncbi:MAG: hypothetical protein KME27_24925 [Lyngbya sp. HA4199-MV5]|nr:hypothetical protein [Lyngbya sp. HA4199-MV5]
MTINHPTTAVQANQAGQEHVGNRHDRTITIGQSQIGQSSSDNKRSIDEPDRLLSRRLCSKQLPCPSTAFYSGRFYGGRFYSGRYTR